MAAKGGLGKVVIFPGTTARLSSPGSDLANWLGKVGNDVANEAKRLAPVDTGQLRASITAKVVHSPTLFARIGTNVNYAIYVHEGTANYEGTEFLWDALLFTRIQ